MWRAPSILPSPLNQYKQTSMPLRGLNRPLRLTPHMQETLTSQSADAASAPASIGDDPHPQAAEPQITERSAAIFGFLARVGVTAADDLMRLRLQNPDLVQLPDSPVVPQSGVLGMTDAATGTSGTATNGEPKGGAAPPARPQQPGTLVRAFSLDLLDEDAGIESRELHPETVDAYAQLWASHADFPSLLVYHDGVRHYLADGSHRKAGARKVGLTHVPALVRDGTRLEALEASLKSNHTNAERRTDADKRYAADKAIKEFSDRSDRTIAKMCGVSPNFVGKRREILAEASTAHEDSSTNPAQNTRVGHDRKRRKMPTRKAVAQANSAEQPATATQRSTQASQQSIPHLTDQAKALLAAVRQFKNLKPKQVKRLKTTLAPTLANLVKALK